MTAIVNTMVDEKLKEVKTNKELLVAFQKEQIKDEEFKNIKEQLQNKGKNQGKLIEKSYFVNTETDLLMKTLTETRTDRMEKIPKR